MSFLQHACLLAIAAVTFLIHGYHPFADDAGLYVAGIEKLLDPTLLPKGMGLILAHARIELFYTLVVGVTRLLHGRLEDAMLLLYLATLAAYIYAVWYVSGRITACRFCRWTAVALAGCLLTLPVAGTSINIMEPYLGARSFVAPLGLFAVGVTLDRRWLWLGAILVASALMHPELTIYTGSFVLVLALLQAGRTRLAQFPCRCKRTVIYSCGRSFRKGHVKRISATRSIREIALALGACVFAVLIAAVLYAISTRTAMSLSYEAAERSRTYVFLSEWHWYEWLGLILPLCLFAVAARRLWAQPAGRLAAACLLAGTTSVVCSAIFVHPGGPGLLARLMMLRMFHLIYLTGVVLLGCGLGALAAERALAWRAAAVFGLVVLGFVMFLVQTMAFGHSHHLELPGVTPRNAYQQAFLWIRANTPPDAVLAADPMLVFAPGEDEQNLRAMSQRSILADYKDEGLAFVFPASPADWYTEFRAQNGLAGMTDAERRERLKPLGASWVVLPADAATQLSCPYRNAVVAVCTL